ncbi:MAG: LamG-like jellyroll fold domain-containing protein, partial [Verrucomicrobiota bacterium]
MKPIHLLLLTAAGLFPSLAVAQDIQYKWQEPQATITETGAVLWNPKPFEDNLQGQDVRYIDFEGGYDTNSGTSPDQAWKHHPWDRHASGKAAEAFGPLTYVFKRGVFYRNVLKADESGTADKMIRLTSTKDWGEGQAVIAGSILIPNEWKRVDQADIEAAKHLPDQDKVWVIELAKYEWWNNGRPGRNASLVYNDMYNLNRGTVKAPFIGLYTVTEDGGSQWHHLARDPDWQPAGTEFAHDYWHDWEGEGDPIKDESGEIVFQTVGPYEGPAKADELKGKPQDFFDTAIVWSTYPSLMGSATPKGPLGPEVEAPKTKKKVATYHPDEGVLAMLQFHGFSKGTRFKIENVPGYLDTVGEFYLDHDPKDKEDKSALLYFRPEEGKDPNDLQMELAANQGAIDVTDQSHIEISGLEFRYINGTTIQMGGTTENVAVRNCIFRDLLKHAIVVSVKPDYEAWTSKKWQKPEDWKLEQPEDMVVADNEFHRIWDQSVRMTSGASGSKSWPFGFIKHCEVLRNKFEDVGIRHSDTVYTAIPAIWVHKPETAIIAGNVIKRSFGSGILVHGGQTFGFPGSDWPLTRILIYNNSTEDTALAVNDYGGLSLWEGGQMYAYNNNIGNSTGYMPGGLWRNPNPLTLSYPYYIDGGYKIYGFNNVIWDRSVDPEDPFRSETAGYFSVFGFLNHFANNTLYRHARATGGSSGNRTDVVSNVFAEISEEYVRNNRVENPSLVGGGDTGKSGIVGIPSLAYGRNIFHGDAVAGELVASNPDKGVTVPVDITGPTIEKMAEQMQEFPTRWGQLGTEVEENPVIGELEENALTEKGAEGADFRLTENSPAIDAGAKYFIPWALGATVGEWNFTENHADPTVVTDYALYMGEAYYDRFMYPLLPVLSLKANEATLESYVSAPSEDWVNGAMHFDGKRFCSVLDEDMRADAEVVITQFITGRGQQTMQKYERWPKEHWTFPEPEGGVDNKGNPKFGPTQVAKFAGERRNTLISTTRNLLIEAMVKVEANRTDGYLANKQDGKGGYALMVNDHGKAQFSIGAEGKFSHVASDPSINDGDWHHVLAEVDRQSGRMTIYIDGEKAGEAKADLAAETSIDNQADFTVGKSSAGDEGHLVGDLDFLRVCHATLED